MLLEWLLALQARPTRSTSPGAAPPFRTAVGCHWLPFLRDPRSLAVIAVIFCPNDSAAHGQRTLETRPRTSRGK